MSGTSDNLTTDPAGGTGLITLNVMVQLDLQSTAAAVLRIGANGNGTYPQNSGSANVQSVQMAETIGTATFELLDGTFVTRDSFFLGGATNASVGTGTATATVSGGTLSLGGCFCHRIGSRATPVHSI
jgi:hypothetical protein